MTDQQLIAYIAEYRAKYGAASLNRLLKREIRQGGRDTPTKRKPIKREWVLAAAERQQWMCKRCRLPLVPGVLSQSELTGDHTIPLSEGGKHTRSNISAMHRSCNSSKGSKMPLAESKASGRTILEQVKQ